MGLGRILGKIGKVGLGFIPGGNVATGILDAVGTVAGGMAKDRGAAQQSNETLGIARANADINRRKFMVDAPAARLGQSKSASMIANYQPTSVALGKPGFGKRGDVPQFNGGFENPGLYSPEARQQANDLIYKNLQASLGGADAVPELPQVGHQSAFDKILGYGGSMASILAALGKAKAKAASPAPDDIQV